MFQKKIIIINLILFISVVLACLLIIYKFSFFGLKNFRLNIAIAEDEEDDKPPVISNINISDIAATSTKITWSTDEDANSLINYSINKNYGINRDSAMKKSHEILLDDLLSEKLYYFRIISSDYESNQSISNDYSFITPAALSGELPKEEKKESAEDLEEKGETVDGFGEGEYKKSELIEKTLGMLEQIRDEEGLSLIETAIQNIAEGAVVPPVIRGDFANVEAGTDYAVIKWTTDKESNSMVHLSSEEHYD